VPSPPATDGLARRRTRWILISVVALAIVLVAVLIGWARSPFEVLSGPYGTLSTVGTGVPAGPARYQITVDDPVIAGGAAVVLDGSGVRAINLSRRSTYWRLSRPGSVSASSLWALDERHAAVIWSDRRLTVIDVPTGHRWDRDLPDHGLPTSDLASGTAPAPGPAVYALPAAGGGGLVVVVQPTGVDAYDTATGGPAWSYATSSGQGIADPAADARPTGSALLVNLSAANGGNSEPDQSVVVNDRGHVSLRISVGSNATPMTYPAVAIGGGRIAQAIDNGIRFQVYDAETGQTLYRLPGAETPSDITGGRTVILTGGRSEGPVTAYSADDGRPLWRRVFTNGSGPGLGELATGLAVYRDEARILQQYSESGSTCAAMYRLVTLDANGAQVGVKPLSAFNCQPLDVFPRLVDGRDGVLVVANNASIANGHKDRYVLYVG
jgi:hypothetical protein